MPNFVTFLEGILGTTLSLTNVPTNSAEEPPPALFINEDSNLVEKRVLGLNAFNSTTIPTNAVLTSGNQTVSGLKTFSNDLKTTGSIAVGNVTNNVQDGRIDAANDVVAFSTSDIRLKDNIKSIDKALDKVNSIQGIEFDWIEKEGIHGNSGHDIGVIAQEVEKILPDVVTTRDNGYKAVKYEKIVPLLIEAIKELTNEINELKNK